MPRNGVPGRPDQRFPPAERLRLRADYERVYQDGRAFRTSLVVLFVLSSNDLQRMAGFVAGRRVGAAVARNRAKRLLREGYRRHRSDLPATGAWMVWVARVGCAEATFAQVERDMLALWTEAGLLNRETPEIDRQEGPQDTTP